MDVYICVTYFNMHCTTVIYRIVIVEYTGIFSYTLYFNYCLIWILVCSRGG